MNLKLKTINAFASKNTDPKVEGISRVNVDAERNLGQTSLAYSNIDP